MMDPMDRKILDVIQKEIPIVPRAFQAVAQQVGTTEMEVIRRIQALKRKGIVRRIGGSFDAKHLGYHSVLVAAKVPEEKLKQIVSYLNRYTGVTHNYRRNHEYNIWFTLTAASEKRVHELLATIKADTGITEMVALPSFRKFKIKVHFQMGEEDR